MSGMGASLARLLGLVLITALSLQLYFLARVGTMVWIDPQSTAYQRSEAWRLATQAGTLSWAHRWLPSARISANLKRAVIAAEEQVLRQLLRDRRTADDLRAANRRDRRARA